MELCAILHGIAAVAAGPIVKTDAVTVLPFPGGSSFANRHALRSDLEKALRISEAPVILDFSGCKTLDYEDIDLLLESVAQVAGRDKVVVFVTGSRVIRVLLEVTRIASLAPVFDSMTEAMADLQFGFGIVSGNIRTDPRAGQSQDA